MNSGQVRRWLNDYVDGLLFIMAVIKILAESPSWDIELTCIQLRNTSYYDLKTLEGINEQNLVLG